MSSATPSPQISMYETIIEDPELEALLEERHKLKLKASAANKAARDHEEGMRARLDALDIADAPVRIGRFLVSYRPVAARSVEFETEPTTRLHIRPLDDAA